MDEFEQALRGHRPEHRAGGGRGHKTQQLCRQVERAVAMAIAGECGDDLLRELTVDGVVAMGGASQLLVRLRVPAAARVTEVMARLDLHAGRLRTVVAAAICRKRVPTLAFVCLPATPAEGGGHD